MRTPREAPGTLLAGNISGLQVLRALAALMVVVFHARFAVPGSSAWPTFGEAGVDIFFVISGFVMALTTRNLAANSQTSQRLLDGADFLARRIVRVVPVYWLVLLWTSRRDLVQGIVGLDLLKDFAFLPHPNAAYPGSLAPTVTQGWTLNYEMFFYCLFALSLLFGRRRTVVLVGTLLALVVAGYGATLAGWPADAVDWASVGRRFYTHNIILEFCYGVLLQRFVSARSAPGLPRGAFFVIALGGMVLLALFHGVGPRCIGQGLPALLIVWASLYAFSGLRLPVLELLGDASYAIYLIHFASFGALKPVTAWLGSSAGQPLQVAALMALHVLFATFAGLALHLWIEKPFTRWARGRLFIRRNAAPANAAA